MDGTRTRGHPAAMAAIAGMIAGHAPHAVLLVGSSGVGKTTVAMDLAAGLLCTTDVPVRRPCGRCRSCRLVTSDRHPDVHRIGPEGPGRQVAIGGPGSRARGIRDLIADLALHPVEGGARVAIVEAAQRMNEDAQAALLKTLEEPPAGVILILCADAEEPLLPTIRSRCARIRLGPVSTRDIEAILGEHGAAEAPLAARLARIAAGRPGLALAWASDPEALRAREEVVRTLLDLLDVGPAERLAGVRGAAARAARMTPVADDATAAGRSMARVASTDTDGDAPADPAGAGDGDDAAGPSRTPAAERRRAAEALVSAWSDLARDVALCQRDLTHDVREVGLIDETQAAAGRLPLPAVTEFLDRLGRAAVLLRSNVAPELVLDDLAVHWPRPEARAA